MKSEKLNVNIAKGISELEYMLKEFRLKKPIYKMFFRGKGLEFEGYRNFAPDDDAGSIDWKASSRAQKLLIKQYIEERDLRIMFLIDVGDNMVFGSTEKLKCEYATELAAAFARVIVHSNDRIGFVLFGEDIVDFSDCKAGEKQFSIFIETLSKSSNYGGVSNIDKVLDFALSTFDKSISSVILISDFLKTSGETQKKLFLLSNRFETIVIRVRDPLDVTLPNIGKEIILENPVTSEQILINPNIAKKAYEAYASQQGKRVEDIFKKSGVDYLDLFTDQSFAAPLTIFLKKRLEGG